MNEPLRVEITTLAARQIRRAEEWWRVNRTAAPNAVRLELQRALVLIAEQPRIGSRATNVKLQNVREVGRVGAMDQIAKSGVLPSKQRHCRSSIR